MTDKNTIEGKCHCGSVSYQFNDTPEFTIRCNCSTCRRLGVLWIYTDASNINIIADDDAMLGYTHR